MTLEQKLLKELKEQNADELTLKWVPIMLKTDKQKKLMLEYLKTIREEIVERQQVILKANQIQHMN